jgi:acyl-CoA thioesterase-2
VTSTIPHLDSFDDFRKILTLTQVSPDTFETAFVVSAAGGIFGGQIAALTARAAALTVDSDRTLNSFHSYFLRAGRTDLPVTFVVHRERDGRSYSHRRVEAMQEGDAIFSMSASFHVPEDGPHFECAPPENVWNPDDYPKSQIGQGHPEHSYLFDQRLFPYPVHPDLPPGSLHAPSNMWIRPIQSLGNDVTEHLAVLTYISDMGSAFVEMQFPRIPFGGAPTLDHTLWMHRPFRTDQWLLLYMEPVMVYGGRGMYHGSIFDINKNRLCTFSQELVLRPMSDEHLARIGTNWKNIADTRSLRMGSQSAN